MDDVRCRRGRRARRRMAEDAGRGLIAREDEDEDERRSRNISPATSLALSLDDLFSVLLFLRWRISIHLEDTPTSKMRKNAVLQAQLSLLLGLAPAALSVSLADFQSIGIGDDASCLDAYTAAVDGCSPDDFLNGGICSDPCIASLQQLQIDVASACRAIQHKIVPDSLLGFVFEGLLPGVVCSNVEVVLTTATLPSDAPVSRSGAASSTAAQASPTTFTSHDLAEGSAPAESSPPTDPSPEKKKTCAISTYTTSTLVPVLATSSASLTAPVAASSATANPLSRTSPPGDADSTAVTSPVPLDSSFTEASITTTTITLLEGISRTSDAALGTIDTSSTPGSLPTSEEIQTSLTAATSISESSPFTNLELSTSTFTTTIDASVTSTVTETSTSKSTFVSSVTLVQTSATAAVPSSSSESSSSTTTTTTTITQTETESETESSSSTTTTTAITVDTLASSTVMTQPSTTLLTTTTTTSTTSQSTSDAPSESESAPASASANPSTDSEQSTDDARETGVGNVAGSGEGTPFEFTGGSSKSRPPFSILFLCLCLGLFTVFPFFSLVI
ncbi:MAG: hypothetical protein M1815_000541 [Lichina confinis]|nr:MAG: hypothetical protein M1815_000541 [Lichina confinis]